MNIENRPLTKQCPFCSQEIPTHAFICKHCGKHLKKIPVEGERVYSQYSNAQAPWRMLLLYVVTFGIYHFYWFYRNWKHFKIDKNLSIWPGWRTVGLFIPIVNILLISLQFRDIQYYTKKAGCPAFSSLGLITFGYIILRYISFAFFLYERYLIERGGIPRTTFIDLIQFLIYILSALLLIKVQKTLNKYWKTRQPELKIRTDFSTGEAAFIIIGGVLWLLTLAGIFIPDEYLQKLQRINK